MSYIRSLSNPESLYIWGNDRNEVEIICAASSIQRMPAPTFHGILKRWWANEHVGERTILKYQGAILEQTGDFRWRLSYDNDDNDIPLWDDDIVLWDVTLTYLCVHNQHRWNKKETE